jgi:hypothetical protein
LRRFVPENNDAPGTEIDFLVSRIGANIAGECNSVLGKIFWCDDLLYLDFGSLN